MEKNILINGDNNKTKIIFKNNFINKYIDGLEKTNKKIFCIIDLKLKKIIKNKKINLVGINGSERIKSFKYYQKISEELIRKKIDRSSILIAIGGGTIGDLAGFIASTLLRGIDLKLIPTTLLSQVDSSIGGKNGINSYSGKNLIGTFYHPSEVIIDTKILKTLPLREIKSGYVEILKHSLIKDLSFFKWLDKNYKKIFSYDFKIIEKAVFKSILIKSHFVKKDPKEKLKNHNSRAMLNFGHTIGHALETFYNYNKLNHGEAIAIGIIIESKISYKSRLLSKRDLNLIIDHFKKTRLKMEDKNIKKNTILGIIAKDKKNSNNKVNIVLLKKIGIPFFSRNTDIKEIKNLLKLI